MKFMVFLTRYNLDKHAIPSLKVGDADIINNKNITSLGAILDPHIFFKDHITNKSKIALYNLSLICKIRNFLITGQLKKLTWSLVLTHLDYSNAILVNLPNVITKLVQLVPNFAAKMHSTRENGIEPLNVSRNSTGFQ